MDEQDTSEKESEGLVIWWEEGEDWIFEPKSCVSQSGKELTCLIDTKTIYGEPVKVWNNYKVHWRYLGGFKRRDCGVWLLVYHKYKPDPVVYHKYKPDPDDVGPANEYVHILVGPGKGTGGMPREAAPSKDRR